MDTWRTAAAVTLAAGAGYYWFRRRQHQSRLVEDYQAAFPTAQWVSAMRAADAASAAPKIGRNVGAGPDTLAATLAGEAGMKILDASAKKYSTSRQAISAALVDRTQTFDEKWVAALDAGVKQFVILAAGLDARAWRLPRMDKSVRVFEVDVPVAHAYKNERVATLDAPLPCTRVVVEADLSDPGWVDALTAAGFEPSKPSFFLIEGLLMYLPPGAPQALLRATAGLMSPGSTLTGDTFVGSLSMTNQDFVRSLGTKWTFDFPSHDAITELLAAVGLSGATVEGIDGRNTDGRPGDAGFAAAKAKKMQTVLLSLGAWPEGIKEMTVQNLLDGGDEGVKKLVVAVVDECAAPSKLNFHGLAAVDAATKAEIVRLTLATPLAEARHGSTQLSAALEAEARQISQGPSARRSRLQRWWAIGTFMLAMARRARATKGGSTYVIYEAKQA